MQPIQLDNAVFEGSNTVYLLDGEGGPTTLIDAGATTDGVYDSLTTALEEHGTAIDDLDQIVLTHWHYDHSGLAGRLQAESGATVRIHHRDAPLVTGNGVEEIRSLRDELFEAWGIPDGPRGDLVEFLEFHKDLAGADLSVESFEDGDTIQTAEGPLEVVHLPGHAAGLSALLWEDDDQQVAFVGDAILPEYTPNVGGADPRVDDPVGTYVESLQWIASADLDRAYPGHRDAIDDPAARAEEIIAHHEDRTERTREILESDGVVTPWDVSSALFGDLSNIHIMHGPGEAWAHLQSLVRSGEASKSVEEGLYRYRPE